jgi:hypothetical protein
MRACEYRARSRRTAVLNRDSAAAAYIDLDRSSKSQRIRQLHANRIESMAFNNVNRAIRLRSHLCRNISHDRMHSSNLV